MLVYLIIGLISGILLGMGVGSGVLFIPLSMLFGMPQLDAQILNMFTFIPAAIVASIINIRSKLVNFKYVIVLGVPAVIFAGVISNFNILRDLKIHRYAYAILLICLGIWGIVKLKKKKFIIKQRLKLKASKNLTKFYIKR